MEQLYRLEQIRIADCAQVGYEAFRLSEIIRRGYPVLPGVVVPAGVFEEFLETLNNSHTLVADLPNSSLHLNAHDWQQLQFVSRNLRREINGAVIPQKLIQAILESIKIWEEEHLIFRPSISISNIANNEVNDFCGILESQIVTSDSQGITLGLKSTWSQLYRAKSLFYCQQCGIDLRQVKLSILIQPIKNAIASGTLESSHWGWEIKSTWGLGIAISSGEVIPDTYSVERENGVVREQRLGNKIFKYRLESIDYLDNSRQNLAIESNDLTLLSNYNCLTPQILEEVEQQQFSLTRNSLQNLNDLAYRLSRNWGNNFQLQWTISEDNNLVLTDINYTNFSHKNSQKIVGLAAATGSVRAKAHIIADVQARPTEIPAEVIVVASEITPDWLPLLRNAVGIITQRGGFTTHAAILAREIGIPAVVNVSQATSVIKNGEYLYLDGNKGEIYRLDDFSELGELINSPHHQINSEIESVHNMSGEHSLHPDSHVLDSHVYSHINIAQNTETHIQPESLTLESFEKLIATKLLVNLSQPDLIEQVDIEATDGIGLLRSELMALNILEGKSPYTWLDSESINRLKELWYEQVITFVRAFAPKPVFYRSLDWRSHEMSSLRDSEYISTDSILGERGTLSYIRHPEMFEFELDILKSIQESGYSNINLILPFVRTVEEFTFCRQQVEKIGLKQVHQFQLWIMAEVPSVLFLLPEYVKAGVEGISIGTNDLTQLLLGVDREKGNLATVFDERHPAVMNAIFELIVKAKELKIPCSICGQAPTRYPEIIDKLIEWGITSISVEPDALEVTHNAIARAEKRVILSISRDKLMREIADRA